MDEKEVWKRYASDGYDRALRSLPHLRQVERLLRMAQVQSGMTIADLGFGSGIILTVLTTLGLKVHVIGVEASMDMVGLAEPKIRDYRSFGGEVTIVRADLNEPVENWGLPEGVVGSFDALLLIHVLYLIHQPNALLDVAATTLLRPGAALGFATPGVDPQMEPVYEEHARLAFPEPGPERDAERLAIEGWFAPIAPVNQRLLKDPTRHYVSRSELEGWISPTLWPSQFIGRMFGIPPQNHAGVLFSAVR